MFAKECVMYTALPKFKSYFYQILEIFAALAEKFYQQNVITCFYLLTQTKHMPCQSNNNQ